MGSSTDLGGLFVFVPSAHFLSHSYPKKNIWCLFKASSHLFHQSVVIKSEKRIQIIRFQLTVHYPCAVRGLIGLRTYYIALHKRVICFVWAVIRQWIVGFLAHLRGKIYITGDLKFYPALVYEAVGELYRSLFNTTLLLMWWVFFIDNWPALSDLPLMSFMFNFDLQWT